MVGVVELVAGAALGSLFGRLIEGVDRLLKKSTEFTPLLEDIKSTLDSLGPLIKQIDHRNVELNLSNRVVDNFRRKILEGVELVENSPKVGGRWYKDTNYTKQLVELDRSLKRQLEILTAEGVRDGKETLALARKILLSVWNMQTSFKEIQESWMVVMFVLSLASTAFMFIVAAGTSQSVVGLSGSGVWLVFKLFWGFFRIVLKILALLCNIAMVPLS